VPVATLLVGHADAGGGRAFPKVAAAVLDAARVVPVLALHPAVEHLLKVVQVLLLGALSLGRIALGHSGCPSIILTDHLDDVVIVARQRGLDKLGRNLHVRGRIIAILPLTLILTQLKKSITLCRIRFRIARRLLHRKARKHNGRNPIRFRDRIEIVDIVLAGFKGRAGGGVRGREVDVHELLHLHDRGRPAAFEKAAVEP